MSGAREQQLDLFFDDSATDEHHALTETFIENPIITSLQAISPDELTPRQALERLYQLKQMLNEQQQ